MYEAMDDCILWPGRVNADGYGTIGVRLAHKAAWESENGKVPPGFSLDHDCHNRSDCAAGDACQHRRCINLRHLVLVPKGQNKARGAKHHHGRKTHCPYGHPYSGDNLMVSKGRRCCRTCGRARVAAYQKKKAENLCRQEGHKRTEKVGPSGMTYCIHCARLRGARGSVARARATDGRFV